MFSLVCSEAPEHLEVQAESGGPDKSIPLDSYMTRKMLDIFEQLDFFNQIPMDARHRLLKEMKIVTYPPETLGACFVSRFSPLLSRPGIRYINLLNVPCLVKCTSRARLSGASPSLSRAPWGCLPG